MPSKQVNIHEAKTTFSKLLQRVRRGEVITIAHAGRPVALLTPVGTSRRKRPKAGFGKGTIKVVGDLRDPMPDDWLDEFYNGPIFPDDRRGQ